MSKNLNFGVKMLIISHKKKSHKKGSSMKKNNYHPMDNITPYVPLPPSCKEYRKTLHELFLNTKYVL